MRTAGRGRKHTHTTTDFLLPQLALIKPQDPPMTFSTGWTKQGIQKTNWEMKNSTWKKKKTQLLSFTRKKTWKLRLKWSTTWKHCLTYDSHKPTSKGHLWDNWEHSNTEYCMLLEHNRCDNGTVLTLLKSLLQMNTKVYIIEIRSCVGLAFKHSRSKKQKQTNKKKQWGPISGETLAKSLKTVEAGW